MSSRYNFSIRSTTGYSSTGVSFLTLHLESDEVALTLADKFNSWLPNYAKVSLSKVLLEASNFELPGNPDLTDVALASIGLRRVGEDGSNLSSLTVKFPLPYRQNGSDYSVDHMNELSSALLDSALDSSGTKFDIVAFTSIAPKNIVSGGAVTA